MVIPIPPKYRRRAPKNRTMSGANPPSPGLLITQVKISPDSDVNLIVTFSGPITWNAVDVPTAFQSYTHDEFFDSPFAVLAVGPDWIELSFNGGTDAGSPWQVVGPMVGISPAVAWPQSGVAEE